MKVNFHSAAELELEQAALWYNSKKPQLGAELREEVENTIAQIVAAPDAFVCSEESIRSITVHRFPYRILYQIFPDSIFIIAVAHHHRDPDYWKSRLV